MHGGKSPGAPRGQGNGRYTQGRWTKEAIAARGQVSELIRLCKRTLHDVGFQLTVFEGHPR